MVEYSPRRAELISHTENAMISSMQLTMKLKRITEASFFQKFFTFVILVAAVLVGIGTYPAIEAKYGGILEILNLLVIVLFTVEVGMRLGAWGATPWKFFKDPWRGIYLTL